MTPLTMLALTFVIGFVGGYGLRAQISFHRRRRYVDRGYYSGA